MYNEISTWMNRILQQPIPDEVVAFCLNLYEMEQDQWSMELIGTETFDLEDMGHARKSPISVQGIIRLFGNKKRNGRMY